MKLRTLFTTLVTLVSISFATTGFAAQEHVEVNKDGVILAGHDVVSYFTKNKAVEGSSKHTATYNDAIYRFATKGNRDTFKADPAKYAPQFGGFCAYGTALGKKFDIDGKAFEIVNGKLFVNKNLDVYKVWVKDQAENIETATTKWSTIENVAANKL